MPGSGTYAEVELAVVCDAEGALVVTIASDHTDAGGRTRQGSPREDRSPNVLAPTAWALADVEGSSRRAHALLRVPRSEPAANSIASGTMRPDAEATAHRGDLLDPIAPLLGVAALGDRRIIRRP